MNNLPIGTTLKKGRNNYIITAILGCGGFGITYKAQATVKDGNTRQTHTYAIKELFISQICFRDNENHTTVGTNDEQKFNRYKHDFEAEWERLRKLKIDNIVKANEHFEENGTNYYVMEYLEGETLQTLYDGKPCDTEFAVTIISQIATAVAFLHKKKILHLDIKPANIIIRKVDNTPILIDFGSSTEFVGNQKKRIREETPGYAAPEQSGEIQFNPSLDIYALGATLYFLIKGQKPPQDVFSISEYLPDNCNENIKQAIESAMSYEPIKRTATIAVFLQGLKSINVEILPIHTIISSPVSQIKYKILKYEDRNEYCITYQARIMHSLSNESETEDKGNPTKMIEYYTIYEYFEKDKHIRRGREVEQMSTNTILQYKNHFINKATELKDKNYLLLSKDGIVRKEFFNTNNTFYYVERNLDTHSAVSKLILRFVMTALIVFCTLLGIRYITKHTYKIEHTVAIDSTTSAEENKPNAEKTRTDSIKTLLYIYHKKLEASIHRINNTNFGDTARIKYFEEMDYVYRKAKKTAEPLKYVFKHDEVEEMQKKEIEKYKSDVKQTALSMGARMASYKNCLRIKKDKKLKEELDSLISIK